MNDPLRVAVVVQGLFEKSDSIGYDAVFQYELLCNIYGSNSVNLFAEKFDSDRYPGLDIRSSDYLINGDGDEYDLVVYHYCDGWSEFDNYILKRKRRSIVRWHNNTPPWFYASHNLRLADRCVRGFEAVLAMTARPGLEFWVNSAFTARQLDALGGCRMASAVVFPASRYLDAAPIERREARAGDVLRLLFVGRVVAHKGHTHIVEFAKFLKENFGIAVQVDFAGRRDTSSTSFNETLSAVAAESGVEVRFHGEVDESDLRRLYEEASVFVCFSEHEGFGLPVFEAMRCGLPVVAWSRTALGELLYGHPLCFEHFDLASFSAAVQALGDPAATEQVVKLQFDLVKSYRRDLIRSQIEAALNKGGHVDFGGVVQTQEIAELRRGIVDRAEEIATSVMPVSLTSALEYGENVVTRHDLLSFRALLDQGGSRDRPAVGLAGPFEFSAKQFATIGGVAEEGEIRIPAAAGDGGHVVFGPYVPVARGRYRATFRFRGEASGGGLLRLDVFSDGRAVLSRKEVKIQSGPERVDLDFDVLRESEVLEFRARVKRSGVSDTFFQGVDLATRVVTPVAGTRATADRKLRLLRWKIALPRSTKQSRVAFRQADALRDKGEFAEAAKAYWRGLSQGPESFPHLVQMGNCLKDSGQFAEAEEAYMAALRLQPHDADAHLQLARLYRDSDRDELARVELLSTVAASPAAVEALLMLKDASVDATDVVALAAAQWGK
ncbi:glycosyltransferase [Brevundimonas bullata]|uniref:glycosyltransferase family 4 protein n=1 Tax=Brevundimonas bullata TaxID=13160 RepID=UPI0013B4542B|nr:glycosyltransferase family 4 protein [Brevundimonas bullata]WQE36981.1 glycosyltransferase [Brevundimonas bullata]